MNYVAQYVEKILKKIEKTFNRNFAEWKSISGFELYFASNRRLKAIESISQAA